MSYFKSVSPNILSNENLREPQIKAYEKLYEHFVLKESKEEALVVLPTGTGKTGLMALAPYEISNGRVLIITPQTVIRDSVLGSLDSLYPKNFWLMTKVFENFQQLPSVIEYKSGLTNDILERSDIVILNVHKLQERLDSSLIKKVPSDFFDMIIIDEAHHAEAKTWKRAVDYFQPAKVLKVTGTPFRSDGRKITGDRVYSYSLAQAMANGYIKSLEKLDYVPDQMYFTIDEQDDTLFTLDQIRELNLKEEDWIRRSVALSQQSNMKLVEFSLKHLIDIKEKTGNPHKIIAVACSIKHAEQIKVLYEQQGYKAAIVHSDMEKVDREKAFNMIQNHEVDVVINVAMLGEGYDHKYLSIAAVFRPFKTLLPYAQFVGRVLRSIRNDDGSYNEDDNIATLIHHKELGLEELWDYYKKENIKKEVIKKIKADISLDPKEYDPRDTSIGNVQETSEYQVEKDSFVQTEMLKRRKERIEEENKKIKEIQQLLDVSEEKARDFYKQSQKDKDKEKYLRPDIYYWRKRTEIDQLIREEMIPQLIADHSLALDGDTLIKGRFILPQKYSFIYNQETDGALLGTYFNISLRDHIGKPRDKWSLEEYDLAVEYVYDFFDHVDNILKNKL
ncbi:DEAD/DEAH box helicase [Radiobacillus deserti]|uniref:Restriction endonuclease subunit R n=1 Tax=Radiobacillus deserti TaxID=2594883 RepID=A0A516KHE2_9BACI|nr:DEAD/DEAH box helicase family protein [Radiobacillus deserti]QDP40797.1 restriction endonuclease subunit R [Radiobacillus deserti]